MINTREKNKALRNKDISCPHVVSVFLNEFNTDRKIYFSKMANKQWRPPIFLYHEARDERNAIHATALYGGAGSTQVTQSIVAGREILGSMIESGRLNDHKRGNILSAFCKIEFVIDTLVCWEIGAYRATAVKEYQSIERQFMNNGLFSTSHSKLEYLKLKKVITKDSFQWVNYAREIRNNLAHSYLPVGSYGVREELVGSDRGGYAEVICEVFNIAWFYILNDLADKQVEVVNYLRKTS